MITRINNVNSENYRILYEKATRELMAYNEENELVRPDEIDEENRPLIMPEVLTEDELANFEAGKYYKWDEAHDRYIVAEEAEPEAGPYYKASDITSLNEYFSYIKNLASINPIYTVLPLDEGTFDIDLNTREISVPEHFAKNGVSVQGDEIAEVIYFKVNRFFDAQDLANDDIKIYIQWKCAKQDENGALIEGVSVPWVVDLETEPNYILFGWPISSKITAGAGEIQFAVRFFKFKDRKIVYSLSTLTQKVKIQPSLDFNIIEQLLDAEDGTDNSSLVVDDNTLMILNRLENSEVIDGGVRAEKPFFFVVSNPGPNSTVLTTAVDEEAGPGGVVGGVVTSVGVVPEFWLAENPNTPGLYDVPTEFKVQGSSHDGGRISYSWRKFNIENKEPESITYGNQYKPTDDTEAKLGKVYYKEVVNNGKTAYQKVSDPVFDSDDEEYQGQLFERFSVANITGVGYYAVTIANRVQNSVARKDSITMVVKMPVTATIETPLDERGHLEAVNEYKTTLSVGAVPRDNSYLTYQWYYNKTGEGGFEAAEPIEGATAATYEVVGSGVSSAAEGAEGDGYYYVVVTSNMNGSQVSIPGNEGGTRVTHLPVKPVVTIPPTHQRSYNIGQVQLTGLKVVMSTDEEAGERRNIADGDSFTYQWYRYSAGDQADEASVARDKAAADAGTYVFDNDVLIEGATEQTYTPTLGGYYYYCVVTNTYNNKKADGYSPFFEITLV